MNEPHFPGTLSDGSDAPKNTDVARLNYLERKHERVFIHTKSGVRAISVAGYWQASVRAAIDAAMEAERREIRASGGNPQW